MRYVAIIKLEDGYVTSPIYRTRKEAEDFIKEKSEIYDVWYSYIEEKDVNIW